MAKIPLALGDLNLNKNELQNAVVQNLASAPANPKAGQIWFNTTDGYLYIYDGSVSKIVGAPYVLPAATTSTLGGVIVGTNISVAADGTISVANASTSGKGVIEIATDAEASTGTATDLAVTPKQLATKQDVISDLATIRSGAAAGATAVQPNSVTAGTYTKVTVDASGLISGVSNLAAGDIPDISATYVAVTRIGAANGVAGLDSNGKVPSAQLPSFVDDVIDTYTVSGATPLSAGWLSLTAGGAALTPETGVIYVVVESGSAYENKTYRWSGSTYVEISASPAQATESTAGIAAIATQAECTTGTNDTKFVTPLKMATYTSGMAKKYTATNPALTASGGVCTWSLTSIPTDSIISVYEVSTGEEVFVEIIHGSNAATIKMNSSSNISAGTYKAIIIG